MYSSSGKKTKLHILFIVNNIDVWLEARASLFCFVLFGRPKLCIKSPCDITHRQFGSKYCAGLEYPEKPRMKAVTNNQQFVVFESNDSDSWTKSYQKKRVF